jgi:hypothetical protein
MFVQTLLRWTSNKYYIFWLCACNLIYPACTAHAPCYITIRDVSEPDTLHEIRCNKRQLLFGRTQGQLFYHKEDERDAIIACNGAPVGRTANFGRYNGHDRTCEDVLPALGGRCQRVVTRPCRDGVKILGAYFWGGALGTWNDLKNKCILFGPFKVTILGRINK